ncbi:MAG: N-acetyltransferase [Lachnospiraceae bacterium]|nr:N-acetyltransferase [Lachnospiraceae bacterium]
MLIRQETPEDYNAVYELIKEAFLTTEYTDGNEHNLVTALRKGTAFIPELSLVAVINGEIVGHIMFTRVNVGKDEILALAPLSVKPQYQKQGVGTALIREGHKIAKQLGYAYVLVLGSETYYPRAGYVPAKQFGIEVPKEFPSENFMAIQLQEKANPISGAVRYAKEFGI